MPIYMNYDGIDKGEVSATGHEKWIEVTSLQWGVGRGISSPTGNTGNRESSAPSVSEITVSKIQDAASSQILQEALTGEGKLVKFDFVKTDKGQLETYLAFELENGMISGYSLSSGGDRPMESVSINFTKVTFKLIPMNEDGTPGNPDTVQYDLATATN